MYTDLELTVCLRRYGICILHAYACISRVCLFVRMITRKIENIEDHLKENILKVGAAFAPSSLSHFYPNVTRYVRVSAVVIPSVCRLGL